jgi:acetylornithine deacetylase/succinyl-diaminopimelate desuccinylase-like protein
MSAAESAVAFARSQRERFIADLARLVRFASVSAQPARAADVRACADWLAAHLRAIGLERARVVSTSRHPIVCAEWRRAHGAPTLLVYGHYDVQPAEPLSEWTSPPFEPTRRGDELVGRGASDDKAQLVAHVKALESYLRTSGSLPVNVVCVFEGEEEIGSPSLAAFLRSNRDALRADVAVVSDTTMLAPDRPALTYGLRGNLVLELEARGPAGELHSGNFGGALVNPLATLCALVASLHDRRGRIAVSGFYDKVVPLAPAEREAMARAGPTDAEILRAARSAPAGEAEYSLYERIAARPALTVTGVAGGYSGAGAKAVLPRRAVAKLDVRLVPHQDPAEIDALIRRHAAARTPAGVVLDVRALAAAPPATCDPAQPAMRAAAAAYGRAFGTAPALIRSGGTVPVVALLQERLRVPTVVMGFGLPDDRMHAPNERAHLPTFARAIETCIWFLAEVARTARAPARPRAAVLAR